MKKLVLSFFALSMAFSLVAEDADLEKKCMSIFALDVPKDSVSTIKIKKRVGKIYESFKEINDKFTPSAEDKARGYAVFAYNYNDDLYPNTVPAKSQFGAPVSLIAAPGEKNLASVGVYPVNDLKSVKVTAGDLTGPDGKTIAAANIEVNVIKYDYEPEGVSWFCKAKYAVQANETACLKEIPRVFYIKVSVPEDAVAGKYKGKLIVMGGSKNTDVEFNVEVRAMKLTPLSDEYYFGAFTYTDFAATDQKTMEKILQDCKKHGMNITHGGFGGAVKVTSSGAEIDYSNIEKNMLLLKKYGHKNVIIEMTGLPNTYVDKMGCGYYDATFNKAYKAMLKSIKDKMEKGGWPYVQIMYDEPREVDTDNPRPLARTYWDIENILKLHNEVGLYALPTYMSDDGGPRFEDKSKKATYWEQGSKKKYVMTHGWAPSAKLMSEAIKNGNTLYLYNCGYGRFPFGLLTYQLKAKGNVQFWYTSTDYFNSAAQFPTSYAVVALKDSPYVPTIRWLRSEQGVNDFKYIYTLQKKIESAKDKSSTDVVSAQRYLDSIGQVNFGKATDDGRGSEAVDADTLKKNNAKLDDMRNKLADYIMKIK